MKQETQIQQKNNPDLIGSLSKMAAVGIGTIATGFAARKIISVIKKNKADGGLSDDVLLAKKIKAAMHPSGYTWMWDGVIIKDVFEVANKIAELQNYKKVDKAYRNLTNRSLDNDLQKELSAINYKRFLKIVSGQYGSNKIIVVEKSADIFKNYNDYLASLTIAGKSFITNAILTGKTKIDANFLRTNVMIEFKTTDFQKKGWLKESEIRLVDANERQNLINNNYKTVKISN